MTAIERKKLEQVLTALAYASTQIEKVDFDFFPEIFDIKEALAQPEQEHVLVTDNTYGYAKSLAESIFKQHYSSDVHYASGQIVWGVSDTVIGILTQIDNMVADMVRRSAQPEQEPRNFCIRCGKRTQGVLGQPQVHTCTPPLWGYQ